MAAAAMTSAVPSTTPQAPHAQRAPASPVSRSADLRQRARSTNTTTFCYRPATFSQPSAWLVLEPGQQQPLPQQSELSITANNDCALAKRSAATEQNVEEPVPRRQRGDCGAWW